MACLEFENADKSIVKIECNDSNTFSKFTSSLILKGCGGEDLGIAEHGPTIVDLGLLRGFVGDLGWVCGVHIKLSAYCLACLADNKVSYSYSPSISTSSSSLSLSEGAFSSGLLRI